MHHCLVADDSAVVRKVARRILERLSFRVSEAEDAAGTVAVCQQDMPDAILLDSTLPDTEGVTLLKALRVLPGGRTPKVLFCIVDYDVAQIARARHAGADDHVVKPFDAELIAEKLRDLCLAPAEA